MPVYDLGVAVNNWLPEDLGYKAWTTDPATMSNAVLMVTAGALHLQRLKLRSPAPITNVHLFLSAGGTSLTVGQCFAGLYNGAGTLIGTTADQSTAWLTAGVQNMALVGGPFTPPSGDIFVACYVNTAGALPTFRTCGTPTSGVNVGTPARFTTANTGLTTALPGTLGAQTITGQTYWAAVS